MNYILAAGAALIAVSSHAGPPARPLPDLRQVLLQLPPGPPAPRQLNPEERAQLRRQLSEAAPPRQGQR